MKGKKMDKYIVKKQKPVPWFGIINLIFLLIVSYFLYAHMESAKNINAKLTDALVSLNNMDTNQNIMLMNHEERIVLLEERGTHPLEYAQRNERE